MLQQQRKKTNLILIIQFTIDRFDRPRAIWTIRFNVGDYDLGTIFFLQNIEGIIVIVTCASYEFTPAGSSEFADTDEAFSVDIGGIPYGCQRREQIARDTGLRGGAQNSRLLLGGRVRW